MTFRKDIQALRGLAVLLIILHHAMPGSLGAGYLGVDIFFVVSGFLITGVIKNSIEQGDFSFSRFYFRRAKRLLPAAYVTFFVTACLSVFFLDINELNNFSKQLIGAVTLSSNFILWQQSGYFDGSANLKPLLHIWSLSLEEQYYLLLPITLFFFPRRLWFPGTVLLFLASLVWCLILTPLQPTDAFYFIPTRAWELSIGSLATFMVATVKSSQRVRSILSILFWPSVLTIIVIPIIPLGKLYPFYPGMAHPGIDALLVCIATTLILLRRYEFSDSNIGLRVLVKVGDFSYSLYLVHWPIFAFLNNAYTEEIPIGVRGGAAVLALCLGFLLYRYVELPVRRSELQNLPILFGVTVTASLILIFIPFGVISSHTSAVDYTEIRRPNLGLNESCNKFTENLSLMPLEIAV